MMFESLTFARSYTIADPSSPPFTTGSPSMLPSKSFLTYAPFRSSSSQASSFIETSDNLDSRSTIMTPLAFLPLRLESPSQLNQSLLRPPRDTRLSRRAAVNPLMRSNEQRRTQRRNGYLGRVDEHRNEQRWDIRGDQILQHDYLAQKKAWEEYLAQEAPVLNPDYDIDEVDQGEIEGPYSPVMPSLQLSENLERMDISERSDSSISSRQRQMQPATVESVDEIAELLAAETRELDALVALHDSTAHAHKVKTTSQMWCLPKASSGSTQTQTIPSSYGSDDEDFEELFLIFESPDDVMDLSGG